MSEHEIYHHGIKGMKWGVRRTPAQLGHKTSSKKRIEGSNTERKKPKQKKKTQPTRKDPKEMSYEELQQAVNRLNLEQRYNQLNPQHVSAGKKFVQKVAKDVIVPVAVEVSKNYLKDKATSYLANQKKKK